MDFQKLLIYGAGVLIIGSGVTMMKESGQALSEYQNQKPIYQDVNGDGVPDKIVKKLVDNKSPFFMPEHLGLEEEVLFGVKVNGKTVYLTKQQFNGNK